MVYSFFQKIKSLLNYEIILLIVLLNNSCSTTEDCFSSKGKIKYKNFDIQGYDKIRVMPGIALVIKQGAPNIRVEAGENLIEKVKVYKQGDFLILENDVSCNFTRDTKVATVQVTTNLLTEVHSKTEQNIKTDGEVKFPILRFINIKDDLGNGNGDYEIEVDNSQLVFEVNSTVNFNAKGKTDEFIIGNYNGDSRILAKNLITKRVGMFYRGTNDAFLTVTDEVKGKILSTGNVYHYANPATIEVEQPYKGRLIKQ